MKEANGDAGKKAEDRAHQRNAATVRTTTVVDADGTVLFKMRNRYRPDEEKMLQGLQHILDHKPSRKPPRT